MGDNFFHGFVELLMIDLMVIISVHFFDDGFPQHLVFFIAAVEYISKLILADISIAILIKHLEGNFHILSIQESSSIDCSRDELLIVYLAISICIQLLNQLDPVRAVRIDGT